MSNVAIEMVPARHQGGNDEDYTLYVRRGGHVEKTNVQTHISYVLCSGLTAEMRALKIWKRLHGLDFLSFYLELFAIRSISAKNSGSVAQSVLNALK